MFESAQPITVTAKLLNVFSVLFEDSSALESIDVTTIIPRILHIATNYAEDVGPIYDGTGKTNRTRTAQGSSRRIRSKTTTKRDPNLEKSYLPEIQCNCCKILQKISQYEKYTQILILNGVEKRLLDLLSKTSDISVQIAAARAISVCARNNSVQLRLTSLGGVGEFARLLKIDNSESRSTALAALAQLTRENAIACRELKRAPNTLPQLVACLKGPEVDVLNALSIVSELSNDDKAREDLHHFDIVPSIVEALSSDSKRILESLALTLPRVIVTDHEVESFEQTGGMVGLLKCLKSPCLKVRNAGAFASALLSENALAARLLYDSGALEYLCLMKSAEDHHSPQVDVAIRNMLDSNVLLKFAMTGVLDFSDITGDLFYDVGRLKASERLKGLECYANETRLQTMPVWLLNIREPGTDEPPAFTLPVDVRLRSFLKSVIEKVNAFEDLKEKVLNLAKEVADFFGGPITRQEAFGCVDWQAVAKYRCLHSTNIVPIGLPIRAGYRHRALLFKFIADKLRIFSTCVCGEYSIAYNVICTKKSTETPQSYVVNLMDSPGALYVTDSKEASQYCRI